MDMKINKNKTGLTFAFLISSMHLCWSIFVFLGIAQSILDFIFKIHMLSSSIVVTSFNLLNAIELVIITFVVGYLFGWLMAFFWNKIF